MASLPYISKDAWTLTFYADSVFAEYRGDRRPPAARPDRAHRGWLPVTALRSRPSPGRRAHAVHPLVGAARRLGGARGAAGRRRRRRWLNCRGRGGAVEVPDHHEPGQVVEGTTLTGSSAPRAGIAADQAARRGRGAAATDVLPHVPGDGVTAYLSNGGTLDHPQQIAGHASPKTTKLYEPDGGHGERRRDRAHRDLSVDVHPRELADEGGRRAAPYTTGATATARSTFVLRAGHTVVAIEVKGGRAPDALPGMAAFSEAFQPSRTLLVGGDGMDIDTSTLS